MKNKLKYFNFILLAIMFFTLPNIVNASEISKEVKLNDIEDGTYIIGKHMFTLNDESYLTIEKIMLASKTIEENTLDAMKILVRDFDGNFRNAVSNKILTEDELPEVIEVTYVDGTSVTDLVHEVSTEEALLELMKLEFENIKLTNDITLTTEGKLEFFYKVNIDGNGKKLIGREVVLHNENSVIKNLVIENSNGFGLQVYNAKGVKLENVIINNSEKGGLLVNGSEVTIKDIALNNNVWGGIEVSMGSLVTEKPVLTIEGTITGNLVSATPYIWIDKQETNAGWVVLPETSNLNEYKYIKGNKYQVLFLENNDNLVHEIANEEMLLEAIELEFKNIKLMNNITLTTEGKLEFFYEVNINGNGKELIGREIVLHNDNSVIQNLVIEDSNEFGLQVYDAKGVRIEKVTINNSAKGGLYVNGSEVTVKDIALNNNVWGGIEVSMGSLVEENPLLTVEGTIEGNLVAGTPYVWIDGKSTNDGWVVNFEELLKEVEYVVGNKNQLWFVDKDLNLNPELIEVNSNLDEVKENEEVSFKLTIKANDYFGLYSLEVDHSLGKHSGTPEEDQLPEFTIYADKTNPYGEGKELEYKNAGVVVSYDKENQTWTIDFGQVITEIFKAKENITFYFVAENILGNVFGNMSPTTLENTFEFEF